MTTALRGTLNKIRLDGFESIYRRELALNQADTRKSSSEIASKGPGIRTPEISSSSNASAALSMTDSLPPEKKGEPAAGTGAEQMIRQVPGQNAAVLEHQGLGGEERASNQVTARAYSDWKVNHLRSENESGHYPEKRYLAFFETTLRAPGHEATAGGAVVSKEIQTGVERKPSGICKTRSS